MGISRFILAKVHIFCDIRPVGKEKSMSTPCHTKENV